MGVGIDKMTAFELAKDGKGLTSLELGFYYNTQYVMPYVGGSVDNVDTYDYKRPDAYKTILTNNNLSGANSVNQWDSNVYHIEEAIPSRACVVEPDTQEWVSYPNNEELTGTYSTWEMLYVSLEKNEEAWSSANRFSDTDVLSDDTIYYVMMLPFVLKQYDNDERICFRLSRNASLFSMGGGEYGAGVYDDSNDPSSFGAWERETRTPNHNLKEMFTFEGDLNIFKGINENRPEDHFNALLRLVGQGTDSANGAKLYPTQEPSIFIDDDGEVISGLTAGTELTLEVTKGSGITVSVAIKDASTSS